MRASAIDFQRALLVHVVGTCALTLAALTLPGVGDDRLVVVAYLAAVAVPLNLLAYHHRDSWFTSSPWLPATDAVHVVVVVAIEPTLYRAVLLVVLCIIGIAAALLGSRASAVATLPGLAGVVAIGVIGHDLGGLAATEGVVALVAGIILLLAADTIMGRERSAREGYEELLTGIGAFAWRVEEDDGVVLSPGALDVLGATDAPATRQAWFDRMSDGDRERVMNRLHLAAEVGEGSATETVEYRVRAADGSERWFSDHVRVESSTEREFSKLSGVAMDVTATRIGDRELRWYSEVFNQATSGYLLLERVEDREQAPSGFRIRQVNRVMRRFTGPSAFPSGADLGVVLDGLLPDWRGPVLEAAAAAGRGRALVELGPTDLVPPASGMDPPPLRLRFRPLPEGAVFVEIEELDETGAPFRPIGLWGDASGPEDPTAAPAGETTSRSELSDETGQTDGSGQTAIAGPAAAVRATPTAAVASLDRFVEEARLVQRWADGILGVVVVGFDALPGVAVELGPVVAQQAIDAALVRMRQTVREPVFQVGWDLAAAVGRRDAAEMSGLADAVSADLRRIRLDGADLAMEPVAGWARTEAQLTDPLLLLDEAIEHRRGTGGLIGASQHRSSDRRLGLLGRIPHDRSDEMVPWASPIVELDTGRTVAQVARIVWSDPILGHLPPTEASSILDLAGRHGDVVGGVARSAVSAMTAVGPTGAAREVTHLHLPILHHSVLDPDVLTDVVQAVLDHPSASMDWEVPVDWFGADRTWSELAAGAGVGIWLRGRVGDVPPPSWTVPPGLRGIVVPRTVWCPDDTRHGGDGGRADDPWCRWAAGHGLTVLWSGVDRPTDLVLARECGADQARGRAVGPVAPL